MKRAPLELLHTRAWEAERRGELDVVGVMDVGRVESDVDLRPDVMRKG